MYNNSAFIDFKLEKAVKQNPFAFVKKKKKATNMFLP